MRVLYYSGTSGDCLEVEKPSDLYPLIDWFFEKMKEKKCDADDLFKIEIVRHYAAAMGLGDEPEVERVKYI